MHGLGLCTKSISFISHVLYSLSFSHNKASPIDVNKKKYFFSLNVHTTVFDYGSGDENKNIT